MGAGFGNPQKYTDVQLYRDSSVFVTELAKIVTNMPHIVQYSIGVMALQEAMSIPKSLKVAYEKPFVEKVQYLDNINECLSNMEVIVNTCFDCKFISSGAKAALYKLLGCMQSQVRGWRDSVKRALDCSKKS